MNRDNTFTVILFIIVIGLTFFNNYVFVNSDIEADNQVSEFTEYDELF